MAINFSKRIFWPLLLVAVVTLVLFAYQKSGPPVEENVSYGTVQGAPLLLDVVRVPAPGLRPAIVFIHGGAWPRRGKSGLCLPPPGLAQRGQGWFAVKYPPRN